MIKVVHKYDPVVDLLKQKLKIKEDVHFDADEAVMNAQASREKEKLSEKNEGTQKLREALESYNQNLL